MAADDRAGVYHGFAVQVARLKEGGCHVICREKGSGRTRDGRTELAIILDFIRPGDTLVVVKLDRLGRSTRDVLNLVLELESKGKVENPCTFHVSRQF